jgi:hypothetical protein
VRLELGECHLDGVEIGTVGRKEQEPGSTLLQDRLCVLALVTGQIVQNDNVTGRQGRGELGLDIELEDRAVHGFVDDPGCGQPVTTQAGDEGLRAPMAEGRLGFEACADPGASAKPGHLRRGAGLVEEDQAMDVLAQLRLARCRPIIPRLLDIGAIGFAGLERFF